LKSIFKKIGSIFTIGGFLISTSLTGVFAVDKIGNINNFIDDDLLKYGEPDVVLVVGENAAALDVTSANKIAVKVGTLTYTETTIEEDISTSYDVIGESEEIDLLKGTEKLDSVGSEKSWVLVTAADNSHANYFEDDDASNNPFTYDGFSSANSIKSLGELGYLSKLDDIDPLDWFESNDDAVELLFVKITDSDTSSGSQSFDIGKDMVYASVVYPNQVSAFSQSKKLKEGYRIPFLGKKYNIVKIDEDNDIIYLGTPYFEGTLEKNQYVNVGGGYQVLLGDILESGSSYKITMSVLKDGKVISEKTETLTATQEMSFVAGDVGVTVNSAWTNTAKDTGFADVVISRSIKDMALGEEYVNNWKIMAVTNTGGEINFLNTYSDDTVGLSLVYTGSDVEGLNDGDKVNIADYVKLVFEDNDDLNQMNVEFRVEKTITTGTTGGTVISKPGKVPSVKLDSEVSLDTANTNLILIGGPVANKLTKKLVDSGKINIDNDSPETIALIEGAANGNNVLVVAGGNRDLTENAAVSLVNMI